MPLYLVTASAILRLASGIFYAGDLANYTEERFEDLKAWMRLRYISQKLFERRGMFLTLSEAADLLTIMERCPASEDTAFLFDQTFSSQGGI